MDLGGWLRSLGLERYEAVFRENAIDDTILPSLTAEDLKDVGVGVVGHRRKLLDAIAILRAHASARAATPDGAAIKDGCVEDAAQRRHVTVMFADLVGSTALSTRMEPDDLHTVISAYRKCVAETVRRFGGFVAKYMGDGVLAYFGYPQAHEDDAERAVRAALALLAAVAELEVRVSLETRVGIATGLVVVGDLIGHGEVQERSIVGEAPNLAARMQQLAKSNQILVAPSTRRLLGQLFELTDLGEHRIKGFDRGIQAWQVLGPSSVTNRFEAQRGPRLTPLVGRGAELALLHRHFRKAKRGKGQLVLVSGEAGIGKSRLIAALRHRLSNEVCTLLSFQCSSYHTSSAWYPVVRHLEDAAGITRQTEIAAKLDQLETFVRRYAGEDSERIVPLLGALLSLPIDGRYPPLGLTPVQQKKRTQSALLALLKARAEEHPVVLVFEDVHWIDPTSLEFLERVRDNVPAWRMLVVVLLRLDFALPWMSQPHVTALTINRLSRLEIASMIESLTKSEGLPRTITDKIASKTDGVPLFVEEVTNAVLEARRAKERDGTPALQSEIAIPDTLHDSLLARLDQLAPTRIVAQVAATIGREFPLELLEAVVPLPKGEVAAAIDRLLAFGLLFRSGHPANRMYAFKHALVRDEAYASLLRDERRDLHVAIAEALRLRFVDIAQTSPELVAHHYTQARKHELAIAYWAKAGQAASEKSAFAEATTHLQTALDLLVDLPAGPQRNELELQLRQLLGGALVAGKGFAAAETIQCFERALALCREFADSPRIFAVLHGIVGFHVARGEFEQSRALAEDLLARARRHQDRTARLMGHRVLGMSLFLIGELAAGRDQLLSALELYDVKSHGPLAVVFLQDFKAAGLTYLALASVLLGDLSGGLTHAHNAVEHAQQLQHPHSICYALTFMAGAHAICGDAGAVSPVADRAIALAREYAFPQWMAGGGMIRGWARVQLGEIEHGLAEIRGGIDALQMTGALIWVQFARYLLAQALSRADRPDQALALVEQLLAQAAVTSGRWYEADLHRLKGDLLRDRDDPAAAEACYERAIALAVRQGARHWQLRATNALGLLWHTQGRGAEIRPRLVPLCASFGDEIVGPDLHRARDLLARTA